MTAFAHLLSLALSVPQGGFAPAPAVSKVVVYPDRARVTRAQSVACAAHAAVRFEGLPPSAEPSSFRAAAQGGAVEGLRVEERTRAEAFAKEVEDIDAKLRELDRQDAALRDAQARSRDQARLASNYAEVAVGQIDHEMTDPGPNAAGWSQAFDQALNTQVQAAKDDSATGIKRRALAEQAADLRTRRARLEDSASRREYVAEVRVGCPAGSTAHVELSYLVGGAGWSPAYEARADEGAGAVDLAAYATVRQATGEPWTGAQLTLSTAVPLEQATPPELQPLQIWSEERHEERKVLVRRDEQRDHAEATGSTTPSQPVGVKDGKNEQPGLAAANQGLSVQLAVPEPADVPGDGNPVRLFVAHARLPAKFALRAIPKLYPYVFRVADLANEAPFPLLAGPVDAYGRSGFFARYALERVAQGAQFHLTFGLDETLKVKRTPVEEIKRETGLFGGNHRFRYAYKLEVANYGTTAREVELSEHYPVSELDDVKVEVEPSTTSGFERKADDGILTWRYRLNPGEKRVVDVAFHVDVPSSYDLGGL